MAGGLDSDAGDGPRVMPKQIRWLWRPALLVLVAWLFPSHLVRTQDAGPSSQSPSLIYDEMRAVYLGNLARWENGVPPLRWNVQMSEAARWFAWDSVENRPAGFCGHDDTLGRSPWARVWDFGYRGFCGGENVFCGYVSPEEAIAGWMSSDGHRTNLLNPDWEEVGLGYYRRPGDVQGYVAQDFGRDPVFSPLIIAYEAVATASPHVDLYLYGGAGSGSFGGRGSATEMMLSNDACFTGAGWQPYSAQTVWSLEPGVGWRTVYAQIRDAVGRSTTVSDTIYLGLDVPFVELGLHLASTTSDRVTLYGLNCGGLPYVQLSQHWFVDDTFATFNLLWGNGERTSDPSALGGSAFRLVPGGGESSAWVWTTAFGVDVPWVAYVRLKVDDNTSASEVVRFSVVGGGTEYGPLSLTGTDFDTANAYQEFSLGFVFHATSDDPFLIFQFWRSGAAEVWVDGVSIFTEAQPVQTPFTWVVPGGNYRGGGVWARCTDGAGNFSPVVEADRTPERLSVTPAQLLFLGGYGAPPPPSQTLAVVRGGCDPFLWDVEASAPWLQVEVLEDGVEVGVDTTGLSVGVYEGQVTITAQDGVFGSPVEVPVRLAVAAEVYPLWLPAVLSTE